MESGNGSGAWTGFLVMAFGVVGLVGIFSTYVAAIPVGRAAARLDTLRQVSAAAASPEPGPALAALRPALGDDADQVLGGGGDIAQRVAAARERVIAGLPGETAEVGFRLRLVLAAFTGAAALFGVAVLSIVRRET